MIGKFSLLKWLAAGIPVIFAVGVLLATWLPLPGLPALPLPYGILLIVFALGGSIIAGLGLTLIARRDQPWVALRKITGAVTASLDLIEMLSHVLDALLELTHTAAARVWLVDAGNLKNIARRGLFPDAFAEPLTLKFGDALPGRVAQSQRAERTADLSQLPNVGRLRDQGFVEFASVPLIAHERIVGVVDIAARHRGELGGAALDLLTSVGHVVGLAIENARLFEAARARQSDAENLYKASMELSSKLDLGQVLDTVTERGRILLNGDVSALCLWDSQNRWLVVGSQNGPADAFEPPTLIGQRIAQRISPLRVNTDHPDNCITCEVVRAPYRQTHIETPLRIGDQVIGCLCVASGQPRAFSDRETLMLDGLAEQATMAIQNARAYDHAGNVAIALERERLAREMHDTLAQILGFVNTKSQALHELLDAGRIDAAREQIDQLTGLSQELYADVREVILGLRAASSPEKSLLPMLTDYAQAFTKQSGIDTRVVIEADADNFKFAPAIELQLIRIVQEALTNIRKHARAQHAIVHFSTGASRAEILIEDDGRGFDPARIARGDWPQFGLATMRERAESIGGAFVVISRPNRGTQIVVQIPLGYVGRRIAALPARLSADVSAVATRTPGKT